MVAESVHVTVVTRVTPVRSVPRGSSTILMRRKTSLAKVIIKTLLKGFHSLQNIVYSHFRERCSIGYLDNLYYLP